MIWASLARTAEVAADIARAAGEVTPEEVYEEENRIQHNIRALVNCIRNRISPAARPYVHLFATSADIMDTARALCLSELTRDVLVPDLAGLVRQLIELARRHASTPQMGRTHGQHAVPLTFGFAMALLMADQQWGSTGSWNYRQEALNHISGLKAWNMDAASASIGGPGVSHAGSARISDFMFGHLRAFKDLTDNSNLDLGVSYSRGHNLFGSDFTTNLYGIDATYHWKPLQRSIYKSFIARSELIWRQQNQPLVVTCVTIACPPNAAPGFRQTTSRY